MSDVWQGPGWWLASDGKWYPADAEPGAVYEGELQNDSPADEVIDPPAPEPVAPEPEPVVVEPIPEVPAAPEPVAAQPVAPTEPDPVPAATFGADPFAQMPAPVVEEPAQMPAPVVEEPKVGGWQSVDPAPPTPPAPVDAVAAPETIPAPEPIPAPQPTVPEPQAAIVEEDGWTSAYEERHDTPDIDVNAPSLSVPAAPEVQVPEVQIPEVQIPEVQIPDVQVPEVQIPDVQIPDVQVPDVQVPDVQIPDVQVPEVQIPDVQAPELTSNPVPVSEIPSVGVPGVDIPGSAEPLLPLPDTDIPEVQQPGMGVPTNPPVEISEVPAQPVVGDDTTVIRDATAPIERDDAWRKPSMADDAIGRPATAPPTTNPGVPDVVDLAIPDEAPAYVPEPQGRRWGVVAAVIAGLLIVVALAWFITTLFTGDDGVDTVEPSDTTAVTEPDTSDAPASTDASAPSTNDDGGEENPDVSVFALRAGDCIVGDIGAGQVTKVTKVDCEEEHQFEVYREALIESSITSFDEEAISAYAEEVCRTSLEAYIPPDDDRGLKFKFLQPTEDSWNQAEDPDRVITCLLFDDDAPLVGRAGP